MRGIETSAKLAVIAKDGKQVDLRDMESELETHPLVKRCRILVKQIEGRPLQITAYAESDEWLSLEQLLDYTSMPADLCPTALVVLDRLPVTKDGNDINDEVLAALEVPEQQAIEHIRRELLKLDGIDDALLFLRETASEPLPLHLASILPEAGASGASPFGQGSDSRQAGDAALTEIDHARVPALVNGGELLLKAGEPLTLSDALRQTAAVNGQAGMLHVSPDTAEPALLTYSELVKEAGRLAGGLTALGLRPSDKAILLFDDNDHYLRMFWGCTAAGVIPVPLTIPKVYDAESHDAQSIRLIWEQLGRPAILASRRPAEQWQRLYADMPVVAYDSLAGYEPLDEWHASAPDDTAILLFTSGSTGQPKGVVQTHRNILARQRAAIQTGHYYPSDVMVNWFSLEHVVGIIAFHLLPLYMGAMQVHARSEFVLEEPLRWLDMLSAHKATVTWAPNSVFALVNEQLKSSKGRDWDLSSVRRVINAGEAVMSHTCKEFLRRLAPYGLEGSAVKPEWGMSETCCMTIASEEFNADSDMGLDILDKRYLASKAVEASDEDNRIVFVSCGHIYPGLSMRIVDERGALLNEGDIGRFQVTGATVLPEYYNNPEVNRASFSEDGWLDTGDMGFIRDGKVTFTGRLKDIIIINGINYQNADIETAVEQLEGIDVSFTAACAIRDPHQQTDGAAVFYCSLLQDENGIKEQIQKIKRHILSKMGLSLSTVIAVERTDIPKTNIGKIQRSKLVKLYQGGHFAQRQQRMDRLERNDRTLPDWFFKQSWVRAPYGKPQELAPQGKTDEALLLLSNDRLAAEHLSLEVNCIVVGAGKSFRKINKQAYEINPGAAEDYDRLLSAVASDGYRPQTIIHAYCCAPHAEQISSADSLRVMQELSGQGLMHLVQAIARWKRQSTDLIVATSYACAVRPGEPIAFEQATAIGIAKTIAHEFEDIRCKHIDFDTVTGEQLAAALLRECATGYEEVSTAYRQGARLLPRLEKLQPEGLRQEAIPLKQGGLYMVTGGLGGVGRQLCRLLLEKYDAKLLIIGRQPLDSAQLDGSEAAEDARVQTFRTLARFAKSEGQLLYQTADIGSLDELEAAVKKAEAHFEATLDGAVHLAGVISEQLLADMTAQSLHEAVEAKLYGTFAVNRLLEKYPGSLMIGTSTVRTIESGMKLASYSAGNQFAEAFAAYQRHRGIVRSYCLAWGFWDEIGMGHGLLNKSMLLERGYAFLDERTGPLSLLAALGSGEPVVYAGLDETKRHMKRLVKATELHPLKLHAYVGVSKAAEQQAELEPKALARFIGSQIQVSGLEIHILPELPAGADGEPDLSLLWLKGAGGGALPEAPTTGEEKLLAGIWRTILQVGSLGLNDHFFERGGNSLKATQMVSAVNKQLGLQLELRHLFEGATLRHFADTVARVAADHTAGAKAGIGKADYGSVAPMSAAQRRQWFMHDLNPDLAYYNNTMLISLTGELDPAVLASSIRHVAERHETLRTAFGVEESGALVQTIHAEPEVSMSVLDMGEWDAAARSGRTQEIVREQSMQPFDLTVGPLCRHTLIKLGRDEHLLVVVIHHIISDGWSLGLYVKELASAYERACGRDQRTSPFGSEEVPGWERPLPIQYADYAIWQAGWSAGPEAKEQLDYWTSKLAGELPALAFPTDKPRPLTSAHQGGTVKLRLDSELKARLQELANARGATLYMVLLAAFTALLHRYTGQHDMIVGSLIANRNRPELEPLIGFFSNTLPLRIGVEPTAGFDELLETVKETAMGAYRHQEAQFDAIVDALKLERDSRVHPLFQILFVLQNAAPEYAEAAGLQWSPQLVNNETSKFDLTVQVFEIADGLDCLFEYDTELFHEATIERMMKHYLTLLHAAASAASTPIKSLPMLTEEETRQILEDWNDTATVYPDHAAIHRLFEEQAAARPDAPAVLYGSKTLTYKELNEQANRAARFLRSRGVKEGSAVGILAKRSDKLIIGTLAILKAGGAYVPINSDYPVERMAYMLEDSRAALLLSDDPEQLPEGLQPEVIPLDDARLFEGESFNLQNVASGEQVAYMMYTSGSTGKPKGVMVEHRSIARLVKNTDYVAFGPNTRVLQTGSPAFDAATFEIWGALLNGGRLYMVDEEVLLDPLKLRRHMDEHAITTMWLTAPLFNQLVNEDAAMFAPLDYLIIGGDALSAKHVQAVRAVHPALELVNGYGPTENTTFSTTYSIGETVEAAIPIGRPIANSRAYIVDKHLNLVPAGVVGELCLAGDGLSRGYLNNKELTAEKFVISPFADGERMYRSGDLARWRPDGLIEYMGRIDSQVKIRGFRIELSEIEHELAAQEGVKECVVIPLEDGKGGKRLAAYIAADAAVSPDVLVAALKQSLPDYMIPSYMMKLDSLPLNQNGKVDRKALPLPEAEPVGDSPGHIAPRSDLERKLAAIWQELLGVVPGVEDDFFTLGGDSISLIQMMSRVRKAGYTVEPSVFFRHKTIAQLAKLLSAQQPQATPAREERTAAGDLPLTPVQHWFFEQQFERPEHWNLPLLVTLDRPYSPEALQLALQHVWDYHDGLRLIFREEQGQWKQCIEPVGRQLELLVRDVDRATEEEWELLLRREGTDIQQSLSLQEGPLLKAVCFRRPQDKQHLLLAAHHLIMDGVSWRIIMEDLQEALERIGEGRPVRLTGKTSSYKDYAEAMETFSRSDAALAQLEYWTGTLKSATKDFPLSRPLQPNTEENAATLLAKLDREQTGRLLSAGSAYRTEINDLLLTALLRAYQKWADTDSLYLTLEGHGRDNVPGEVDVSRTVGWFTSIFPVALQAGRHEEIGEQIKRVKETLRAIPMKGLGYGALAYLDAGPEAKAALSEAKSSEPLISFNYLGKMEQRKDASLLLANERSGVYHSPSATRKHLIDMNLFMVQEELHIYFTVHREHAAGQAAALPGLLASELVKVAEHCMEPEHRGFTPSDFPLVSLSQHQLDLLPAQVEDIYPVSHMQEGMLFLSLLNPETTEYFGQIHMVLRGRLIAGHLQEAWQSALQRYPILRTYYQWEQLDRPVQITLSELPLQMNELDISALPGTKQQEWIDAMLAEDRKRPFDLSQPPLMRLHCVKRSEDCFSMVWSFHHILIDGWSLFLILHHVMEAYDALVQGKRADAAASRPYRDFVQWLMEQEADKGKSDAFWRDYLRGLPQQEHFSLWGQRGEERPDGEIRQEKLYLSQDDVEAFEQLAKEKKTTFGTLIQAAWSQVLAAYTGEQDVVFGVVSSGRASQFDDMEEMAGLFINTLPLRVKADKSRKLDEFLADIHATAFRLREYEASSFGDIREAAGFPAQMPLFHTIVVFENYPIDEGFNREDHPLQLESFDSYEKSNHDFSLIIMPGEPYTIRLSYIPERWQDGFAARLMHQFGTLLFGMLKAGVDTLADLALVSEEEYEQLTAIWPRCTRVETLFEDQAEVYAGINDSSRPNELYILDAELKPVPPGLPGEIYIYSDDLHGDCGEWANWMLDNSCAHPFDSGGGRHIYKTGDIGYWTADGQVQLIDLI